MDNRERYFSIFENIKREHENQVAENINSKILIVDFLNTYLRAWTGSPAMNNNGEHVGGVTGFLYSIGNAIKTFQPTRCILVSDGENSAARKRKIYPEYKEKRSVKFNVNRQYDFKNEAEEKQAMYMQMQLLLGYLEHMPIQMVTADATEADDTIAYLAQELFCKKENKVIIMSSDKDFLQLVDDRINVWSPTKKKLYTPKSVLDEYGVHTNNFLYYRTLDGDKSDNIPGVEGVGLKTLKKYIPIIAEEKRLTVDSIIEYATKQNEGKKKLKFYENIINSKDIIVMNERLMDLTVPNISESNKASIRHQSDKKIPLLNKTKLLTMYIHDGLSNAMGDFSTWSIQTLTKLNSYATGQNGEN